MTHFVVVDLETTSREPEKAHVVEFAAVVAHPPWFDHQQPEYFGGLVRPPISIPSETSAIHHIIDADVADMATWEQVSPILVGLLSQDGVIAVAHNAHYERTVLASLNLSVPWLCTYKAALRIWPDAPSHSNEALRYWRGLGTGRRGQQAPHSARHDAEVTLALLHELLASGAVIEDMLRWTDEPALLPRCPIGDYRGLPWSEVPDSFLNWILYKARDMREDIRFCAKTEVDRREAERVAAQKARSQEATADDDAPF